MLRNGLRLTFYALWSVVMTALTFVLGAPPLRLLRVRLGRWGFWIFGVAAAFALFGAGAKSVGVAYLSLIVLIGVYSELEDSGLGFMVSAFFTLLINSLLAAGAFALWVSITGPKWSQQILAFVETLLKPLAEFNPKIQINYYDLMLQLPSVILLLWMVALYVAALVENRLNGGESASVYGAETRTQLAEFRLPDPAIWVFIVALLGAFGGFVPPVAAAIAVNLMNVCLLLLFFQGIAVVAKFFASVRLGVVWQFLFMVLIVVHLFLFVSLLGLVDHWLDFRARLNKRPEELNRENGF